MCLVAAAQLQLGRYSSEYRAADVWFQMRCSGSKAFGILVDADDQSTRIGNRRTQGFQSLATTAANVEHAANHPH